MKKTGLMLLSILLISALLLTGCGEKQTISTAPATEAPTSAPTQAPTEPAPISILGTVEGQTYRNEFIGFAAAFPEPWNVQGAEELQELPDDIRELLRGSSISSVIDSTDRIMDLQAQNPDSGASVNVLLTDVTDSVHEAYLAMSEDQLMDSMLEMKDLMTDSYEQIGMTVRSMEKVTVSFLGEERVALKTVAVQSGMEIIMLQLIDLHLNGSCTATTTFSGLYEEAVEDAMAMFEKIA